MKLQEPVAAARYGPRLWWLIVADVAARSTTERPASQAIYEFLLWIVVLVLCALLRIALRRNTLAQLSARRAGIVVALLGVGLAGTRLHAEGWLSALLILLLSVQAGTFIAAEKRVHVWVILAAGVTVLLFSAAQTHSPLFLPCAASFTFMALSLVALDHRDQRENAAAFEPTAADERPGGGALFAGLTLLLTIPVYLFVPKPAGWLLDDVRTTGAGTRDPTVPMAPPPASANSSPPQSEPSQNIAPNSSPTALLLERSSHVARPESGDYGEDFGIADVQRRRAIANDIVLYARSSHPVNLRGRVYDRFADNRWSRTLAEPQRIELRRSILPFWPAGPTRVAQSIEVAIAFAPTLVHAPGVQQVRFPADSLLLYDDGVLVANEPLPAGTLYSVEARLTLREDRYLLSEPPPPNFAAYLQADGASPRLRRLAEIVTANSSGTLAKALALEHHLRTHYAYTYETIEQQNYTPLDWFLFESRRGHCEFFASALAMLLRSVGIASRVATGFSLGDPNPITGFHEVRALDGHAWVEAYLDGEGWLMLEPTPFYPLPRPGMDQVAEQMDGYLDRLAGTREFLNPGAHRTQVTVLARDAWRSIRFGLHALTNAMRTLGWLLPLVVAAIIGGLLALYLLGVAATDWFDNLQIRRSLDQLPVHDERTATLLVADALLRMTTPRSFARRQDWSLREYANQLTRAALAARHGDVIAIPDEFIEAFEAARYSPAGRGTTDSLSKVIDLVRERIRTNPWPRLHAAVTGLQRNWFGKVGSQ